MRPARCLAAAVIAAAVVSLSATGQPPPGPFPKGAKGPKGKAPPTDSATLLDELTLPDAARRKARDLLRAHDEWVRATVRAARTELLAELKTVLPAEEFRVFEEELAAVPLLPAIPPVLRTVAADDLVTRVLGFDKNGDGRVTADELPERMHGLIEQGDRNRDGGLDRAELERLADRPPPGAGPPGLKGGPPGVKGPRP